MDRTEIARILDEIALLLEIKGDNPFKIRAYTSAARAVELFPGDLDEMIRAGRLTEIPAIGKAIADKITELSTTGRLGFHERLVAEVPPGLIELSRVPGLGPKRARVVHDRLGIATVEALARAVEENRLVGLPGFGEKTQAKVAAGLEMLQRGRGRCLLADADPLVDALRSAAAEAGLEVVVAGEWRRRMETAGSLVLLVPGGDPAAAARVEAFQPVAAARARGLAVTVTPVARDALGAALALATGPDAFAAGLVERAAARGLRLSAAGLTRNGRAVPVRDEAELFAALDLPPVPPEWRDAPEALAAAAEGRLPRLVEERDIAGVFHVHTTYSDGRASVAEMIAAAARRGLRYVGISDHSPEARYAGGVSPDRLAKQQAEIDEAARAHPDLVVLKGTEADILPDGSIDYDPDTQRRFDFIVASVHSRFGMDRRAMTERIVRAVAHPLVTILGHPTGRLLLARDPYAVDIDAVLEAAARHGVIVELNANPRRLDLDWRLLGKAKALGVRISINPDAHDVSGYDDLRYGVAAARKGGLAAADVFNTRPPDAVRAHLEARRARA